jgi:hypothetical protein
LVTKKVHCSQKNEFKNTKNTDCPSPLHADCNSTDKNKVIISKNMLATLLIFVTG